VEDIITTPPQQEPYDRLKAELLTRFSSSREQRVRQLHSHEEMGDREVWSLAQDVPNDLLRNILDIRLPLHVQAIISGQTEAVSSQTPTSRTEFAGLFPCLTQRASPLRRSKTQPGY